MNIYQSLNYKGKGPKKTEKVEDDSLKGHSEETPPLPKPDEPHSIGGKDLVDDLRQADRNRRKREGR